MINENHQKRIVTNEDLFDHISDLKLEMQITKQDLYGQILDLRKSTLDGFDRVFEVIDEAKAELRAEFKKDIGDLRDELKNDNIILRKEMNQRFTIVDNRLSHIEDNMVYKHQLSPNLSPKFA